MPSSNVKLHIDKDDYSSLISDFLSQARALHRLGRAFSCNHFHVDVSMFMCVHVCVCMCALACVCLVGAS